MAHWQKTFRGRHGLLMLGTALLLLTAGCGPGSGQGLDTDGNLLKPAAEQTPPTGGTGGTGGTPASGNPEATLAWLQQNVFGGVCSQCHTGAGAPLGVDWSSLTASCANVGRASGEKPELKEIQSGNPAASYLIWKVVGAGPSGETIVAARMPLNNTALSDATIKNMRDWIADGTPGC